MSKNNTKPVKKVKVIKPSITDMREAVQVAESEFARRATAHLNCVFGSEAFGLSMKDIAFIGEVIKELNRSRTNFPRSICSFAALVEEVGELGKALISEGNDFVKLEAKQTAMMAIRVAMDGDSSFATYRDMKALD